MDIGINLYTHHYSSHCTDTNYGIYIKESASDLVAGLYRNSQCKPSVLLGKVIYRRGNFEVLAAGITGYKRLPITPAIIPSYKLSNFRISVLGVTGVHVSFELPL